MAKIFFIPQQSFISELNEYYACKGEIFSEKYLINLNPVSPENQVNPMFRYPCPILKLSPILLLPPTRGPIIFTSTAIEKNLAKFSTSVASNIWIIFEIRRGEQNAKPNPQRSSGFPFPCRAANFLKSDKHRGILTGDKR